MRAAVALAFALSLAAPAIAAEAIPPETQPAVDAVKGLLKSAKSVSFRKIKVAATGDVCALVQPSAGSDELEFLWTRVGGQVWLHESSENPDSDFVWGNPSLRRSTEWADYQAWKACQKG